MYITTDVSSIASFMLSTPGCIVAYPTETFYGLGSRADDIEGLNRIVTAKGRDTAKGMIVLVADIYMASSLTVIDERQKNLLKRIWPGPVSVVLRAVQEIKPVLAPEGKVALRISPNSIAASLVGRVGPITSTSANRSGAPPARTAGEVARQGLDIDAILDGGESPGGQPSTLIDLTVWPPLCLREGAIPFSDIMSILH
ncbi:MAG: L-threonylcarbamoyladenylate synthase [Desulfobacterota bacterium]|jgi:L-threonylcarbamoyladenylate synthase|nr:L-threonylcarbamoyladenylate synthase [Thermodesulfobacteriota bacterium]